MAQDSDSCAVLRAHAKRPRPMIGADRAEWSDHQSRRITVEASTLRPDLLRAY